MFEASWKLPWTKLELARLDDALASALSWHPGVTARVQTIDGSSAACLLTVPAELARAKHAPWIDTPLPDRALELQLDLDLWEFFPPGPGGPYESRLYTLGDDRDYESGPDGFRDGGTDGGPVRTICRTGESAYCAESDGQIWWYLQGDWRREVWTRTAPLVLAHDGTALWGGGEAGALIRWADGKLEHETAPTKSAIRDLIVAGDSLYALAGARILQRTAGAWQTLDGTGIRALARNGSEVWATTGTQLVRLDQPATLDIPYADVFAFAPSGALWVVDSGRAASFDGTTWMRSTHDVGAPTAIHAGVEDTIVIGREGEAARFTGARWETLDTRTHAQLDAICSSPMRGFLIGCELGVLHLERRGAFGELAIRSRHADNAALWSLVTAIAGLLVEPLAAYDPR